MKSDSKLFKGGEHIYTACKSFCSPGQIPCFVDFLSKNKFYIFYREHISTYLNTQTLFLAKLNILGKKYHINVGCAKVMAHVLLFPIWSFQQMNRNFP